MSLALIIASAILVVASAAFVAIGTRYNWDVTSEGYGRWTRVIGAVSVVALVTVAAWVRIDTLLVAAGIEVGGIVLAVLYVILHRQMTERIRKLLSDSE